MSVSPATDTAAWLDQATAAIGPRTHTRTSLKAVKAGDAATTSAGVNDRPRSSDRAYPTLCREAASASIHATWTSPSTPTATSRSRIVAGTARETASPPSHDVPPSPEAASATAERDVRSVRIHATYTSSPFAATEGRRFAPPGPLIATSGDHAAPPSAELRRKTSNPAPSRLSAQVTKTIPPPATATEGWLTPVPGGPKSRVIGGLHEVPL